MNHSATDPARLDAAQEVHVAAVALIPRAAAPAVATTIDAATAALVLPSEVPQVRRVDIQTHTELQRGHRHETPKIVLSRRNT